MSMARKPQKIASRPGNLIRAKAYALSSEKHSVLVITHYQRLLTYLVPDFVHVLANGRIVKQGGKELALELEQKGYEWIESELAEAR